MRLTGRRIDRLDVGPADWHSIHHRTTWSQGTAQHRRTIIGAAHQLHLVERCGQSLRLGGEVGDLADGAAVSVEPHLVVRAEGADQRAIGLIELLYGNVGHAGVENDRYGKRKGVAGKESERLLFA